MESITDNRSFNLSILKDIEDQKNNEFDKNKNEILLIKT